MAKKQKTASFMGNVLIILFAQVIVKLMGVIYRMVITNISAFSDTGLGFYNAGFQVYTVLLAISSVGIPNAIAKLVSERASLGDYRGAHRIFKSAFMMFSVIGLVFSLLLYIGADVVAVNIIHMEGVKYVMRALAPSIFFVCVSSVIRGYFQGLNDMNATSRSQVYEQIFKCSLTIILVVLTIGTMPLSMQWFTKYTMLYNGDMSQNTAPEIMAAWANAASSIATALSFIYIVIFYFRRRAQLSENIRLSAAPTINSSTKKLLFTILSLSIPISLASIITAINRVIDTATIARGIAIAFQNGIPHLGITNPTAAQLEAEAVRLSGMLSKSDTLINMPLTLNIAFATVLVPTIAGALAKGDHHEAQSKTAYSFLISTLLILPCCIGFIALAEPIYKVIYPNAPMGSDLLALMSVSLIFSALAQTVNGSLQGIGKVFVPAIGLLIGCIVKIILNITLIRIPSVNIYGAAISSIACQIIAFFVSFIIMRRYIKFKLTPMKYVILPVISCIIMGIAAFGTYSLVHSFSGAGYIGNLIAVLAAVAVSVIVYAALIFGLRILNKEEIELLPSGIKLYRLLTKIGLYK